jgi:soluble lytic murein transglycosylase
MVMAAYNGGPGNVLRWRRQSRGRPFEVQLGAFGFEETRTYVKKVSTSLLCYELLDRRTGRPKP